MPAPIVGVLGIAAREAVKHGIKRAASSKLKKKVKTEARNTLEGIALTKAEIAVFRAAKQRQNHESKERKKRGGSKVKPKAKAKAKPKKTAVQKLGSVRNKVYNPVKKRM
jgi:hypothetical protein|tara:strand:- start:6672 stop:7001 length:330 start_codon:yes stop_codon:yes gene_type:complete